MRTRWILTLALLLALLLPGASLAGPPTIHVAPNGVDDTVALEEALAWAQAHGPEAVVELEAGEYKIAHALVVENWSGTIRGQGKYATILRNNTEPFGGGVLLDDAYGPYLTAGMLNFIYDAGAQARIAVEGIGFRFTGFSPYTEPAGNPSIVPIFMATWAVGQIAHVDGTIRDVSMQGDLNDAYPGGNNGFPAMVIERNSGDIVVTDAAIRDLVFGVIGVMWEGGSLTVGGQRPADRVYFKSLGAAGVFGFGSRGMAFEIGNVVAEDTALVFWQNALSGCRVHMSGVETYGGSGAASIGYWGPLDICPTEPSTYIFERNTIRVPEGAGWAGFVAIEDCEVKSQFVISQNRIESALTDFRGPILLNGTRGAVVTNNVLTGTGLAGISLGVFGGDDSGAVLKGNNLQRFEGEVGVLLAEFTSGNTVVGGGKDVVLDDGTDNIISGAGSASGLIGEAVREAMRAARDARELFR
jgi:hypothetical protein